MFQKKKKTLKIPFEILDRLYKICLLEQTLNNNNQHMKPNSCLKCKK